MKQDAFALRFKQLEALLVQMHWVNDDKITTLKGRWQHFQRIGFPPETKTGRGRPALYGASSVVKTLVIFELAALRIPPEQAIEVLDGLDWLPATDLFLRALRGEGGGVLLLTFDPDGLCILRGSRGVNDAEWLQLPRDQERLDYHLGGDRIAIVNVSVVLGRAAAMLRKIQGEGDTSLAHYEGE